jgi:3'-phosphoadenosine 5'-phosphosulfate sulfotransferase (PAPS reductase)/FAD synthetase
MREDINLHDFDIVIINSSAGKDSLVAKWEVCRIASEQNYSKERIHVSHQDLGAMEWAGTFDLVAEQSSYFGLQVHYSKRRDKDGNEETLLEYVKRRRKWPSNKQRYCTSDFKRAPGLRVVTALTKQMGSCKALYVFGFRKDESPARSKRSPFSVNKLLTTKKRKVYDWLPIHNWSTAEVWETIRSNKLPYHPAYDLGMPRLSCVFCIFSPFDALVIAGKHNPELLQEYVETEREIGHTFRDGFSISSVQEAIEKGYEPESIKDWVM